MWVLKSQVDQVLEEIKVKRRHKIRYSKKIARLKINKLKDG
jgi:hypothetical protein